MSSETGSHWRCTYCQKTLPLTQALPSCPFCLSPQPGATWEQHGWSPRSHTSLQRGSAHDHQRDVDQQLVYVSTEQQMAYAQRKTRERQKHEAQQISTQEEESCNRQQSISQDQQQSLYEQHLTQSGPTIESNSSGKGLVGHDQEHQIEQQRIAYQQMFERQGLLQQQQQHWQELQHLYVKSCQHQQHQIYQHQRLMQQQQLQPQHVKSTAGAQGELLLGHDQYQHNQQGLQQQEQRHTLRADDQYQLLGIDQEYEQQRLLKERMKLQQQQEEQLQHQSMLEANLLQLDSQQQQLLYEQQKKIEEQRMLEHQKALQQQQLEQLWNSSGGQQLGHDHHKQQEVLRQQQIVEQQRVLQQQQMPHHQGSHSEQLSCVQQEQWQALLRPQLQLQHGGDAQHVSAVQQRQYHEHQQEMLEQHRRLQQNLKQVLKQQAESDDQRKQEVQTLQQDISSLLQHQAERGQHDELHNEWKQENIGQMGVQQQQEVQHRSQQPNDDQHHQSEDKYTQNVRDQTLAWHRISQEQDTLQQQQGMQQHQWRIKEQLKENKQVFQNQEEGQDNRVDGVVCECGTLFHPGARSCANPNCGKPRPRSQPQGPPCVHCHKPLMREGATKCISCNKKQLETPTKTPQSPGTGISPRPGLTHGYSYPNPSQQQPTSGVQPQSSAEMIVLPSLLSPTSKPSMVFGQTATIPIRLLTSPVTIYQETNSQTQFRGKQFLPASSSPTMVQLQPATSAHGHQGSPIALSGALPSIQGNDSDTDQTGGRQLPGFPASARPSKDQSAIKQNSAPVLPNPKLKSCTTDPLNAAQNLGDTSNELKSGSDLSSNHKNGNNTCASEPNSQPSNSIAHAKDKNEEDSTIGGPLKLQSTPKSDSGDSRAPDPPLNDDKSQGGPKLSTSTNNKGDENSNKKEEKGAHPTIDNNKSYAAALTGQQVCKVSQNVI